MFVQQLTEKEERTKTIKIRPGYESEITNKTEEVDYFYFILYQIHPYHGRDNSFSFISEEAFAIFKTMLTTPIGVTMAIGVLFSCFVLLLFTFFDPY
jgi:hypothetical protein